jgi:AraC-like DNA-binding protein
VPSPAVNDLLTTLRVQDARYVRITARAPWGLSFPARAVARLVQVRGARCWLTSPASAEPVPLTGDTCFLVRAGTGFTLQDRPGRPLADCETLGPRGAGPVTTGGDGEATDVVSVRFSFDALSAETLFALLPPVFTLSPGASAGALVRATFDLIAGETAADGPGAGFVASRLTDVLFVQALRACCTDVGGGAIGWIAALRDPQLAAAVDAAHSRLEHPWTVEELAATAGMSRSAFAASFKRHTGDTPLGYLTGWRMYRAKVLLRDTSLSVQEIAVRVGYGTATALSRVFLSREGITPAAWRRRLSGAPEAQQ